ncbi:MAG: UvrD-helicase domain-containing protein [Candidatus Halalkalibacterium sp. M3_1C_030]
MSDNRLVIASAGSGKTTQIVEEALSIEDNSILITTYTQANEREIKKKIIERKKAIPSNITIQTWFSFLIQHGVKPYQGALNEDLFDLDIRGLLLSQGKSGIKYSFKKNGRTIHVPYKEDGNFLRHYFTKDLKVFSDKLSKFVFKVNRKTKGEVFSRINRLYPNIFIDEVQDLAGYDLELIKQLFKTDTNVLLVGDPRQVTYLTHLERKHKKYRDGAIKQFLLDKCKSLIKDGIDEDSLRYSHRNNEMICKYSSLLYPELPEAKPCKCCEREDTEHDGVFLVRPDDVDRYLEIYNPIQLRWDNTIDTNSNYPVMNFGESKGLTFERVLIYPTSSTMVPWIEDHAKSLTGETRAKFYVGLTRAKYSAAIIHDYDSEKEYNYAQKFV